jgi:thiamine biosynthesis lipoprotein
MACSFEAIVASRGAGGMAAIQACFDEVDRLESILSIFNPSSELSFLNRNAAESAVPVPPELFHLLQFCRGMHAQTEGAFDVTTGSLSHCWGFHDRKPQFPEPQSLARSMHSVGFHHISFGNDHSVSFGCAGLSINLGGVGKGYALDCGAAKLRTFGMETALLSAGFSSILALGSGPHGAGWLVGLRHPVFKDRRLGTVRLHSCALGTSGQEEQWCEAGGQRYGHIFDPRTGLPPKGTLSVTVIADSATCADALATAFFVGGPELANRYCAIHEDVVAIMLLERDSSRPIVIGSSNQAVVELTND